MTIVLTTFYQENAFFFGAQSVQEAWTLVLNWHEKEAQQTDLFLEQISMLYSYTCMLHSIPSTRHSLFCIQYIISGHLNSAPQNAHVAHAVSSRGELIQNLNKLPHLFTVQNVYSTRIWFFNQYVKATFRRKETNF